MTESPPSRSRRRRRKPRQTLETNASIHNRPSSQQTAGKARSLQGEQAAKGPLGGSGGAPGRVPTAPPGTPPGLLGRIVQAVRDVFSPSEAVVAEARARAKRQERKLALRNSGSAPTAPPLARPQRVKHLEPGPDGAPPRRFTMKTYRTIAEEHMALRDEAPGRRARVWAGVESFNAAELDVIAEMMQRRRNRLNPPNHHKRRRAEAHRDDEDVQEHAPTPTWLWGGFDPDDDDDTRPFQDDKDDHDRPSSGGSWFDRVRD